MQNQLHFNVNSGTLVNTGLDDGNHEISSAKYLFEVVIDTSLMTETENC
jgi:hypothetical protein